jgi:hypothetical protein
VEEVRATIAANRALLTEKLAAGRPRWTWMGLESDIARDAEHLVKLEAELAVLEGQS